MAPLPRELIRWLQMLSLPFPVRQPKRDLSNGYLFAEICARYWSDVELHMYENKCGLKNRQLNWKVLRKVLIAHEVPISEADIQDVIDQKDDVAIHVLEVLYNALTNRFVQRIPPLHEEEVRQVPTFIRTTANTSVMGVTAAPEPAKEATPTPTAPVPTTPAAKDKDKEPVSPKKTTASPRAPKPKPPQKSAAIKAVSGEELVETTEETKPVQFTNVTVKAMAPQTLHRMGVEGGEHGRSAGRAAAMEDLGALQPISDQLEKALADTGTPLWSLSGSAPTSALYFARNRPHLSSTLKNIIWSRLMAGSDVVARWILSHPNDFEEFVKFNEGAFSAEDTSETALDNERSRQYLAAILAAMATRNAHVSTALIDKGLMNVLAEALYTGGQATRQRICSVLKSASVTPQFAQHLLTLLFEALNRVRAAVEETSTSVLPESITAFLILCHSFVEVYGSTSASSKALPTQQGNGSNPSLDESLDESSPLGQLAPYCLYHATAGLAATSAPTRAAALRLQAVLVRRRVLSALTATALKTVEHILQRDSTSDRDADNVAQAMYFLSSAISCIASLCKPSVDADEAPEAQDWAAFDPALQHKATVVLRIVAKLCSKSFMYEAGVFPSTLRLHLIKEVGSVLHFVPSLVSVAKQSGADAEPIENNFLDVLWQLPHDQLNALLAPTDAHSVQLYSPFLRSGAVYSTSNAACDWHPLPMMSALSRRFVEPDSPLTPVEKKDINEDMVVWAAHFVVRRDPRLLLCEHEADLPRWWVIMRSVVPDIEAGQYRAEIAEQRRNAGKPIPEDEAALEMGQLCQQLVERFYLHLSGVPMSHAGDTAEGMMTEELTTKALEWFKTVVVPNE